jgi:group I intron endonuclease
MIVYLLTNRLNGKQYVGQTIHSLERRFRGHCWTSSASGKKMPIALAIQKYGKDNFSAEVLCDCANQSELNKREREWAEQLHTFAPNGYNLSAGDGYGAASEEMCRRISAGRKGQRHSDETRKHMSEAAQKRRASPEARRRKSEAMRGKPPPKACINPGKTYRLHSPSGDEIIVVNMARFCSENGLSRFKMSEVVHGKLASHKGWVARHA